MARTRIVSFSLAGFLIFFVACTAKDALAVCTGDCAAEFASNGKLIEKYAKKRWRAIARCARRAEPACPQACPVPDGTAEPFNLSAGCADLIACRVDEMAPLVYQAAWDEVAFCPTGPAAACDTSRAKGAGAFLVKKLKRRRTSKMGKLGKDSGRCVKKANRPGDCNGASLCSSVGGWIDDLWPLVLSKRGYQLLYFTVSSPGEGVAILTLSASTADWGDAGRESVVVEYDVDGEMMGTIVLNDGGLPTDYQLLLGPVSAGQHAVGLRHRAELSPAVDSPVTIHQAASVEAIPVGDPRYDLTRFAPILLGIDTKLNRFRMISTFHRGNAVSDVPVIVYATPTPHSGYTTYRYTMIWSNEDGGTGQWPDLLLAQWGRSADIETIVEVDVADDGSLQAMRYRPDESGSLAAFVGSFRAGTHPMVRTKTANGLIADDGDSTLQFAIAPVEYDDSGLSRATAMDLNPVSYRLMAKEMIRERKTEPSANPATAKLSDLRNYLFLDYNIDTSVGGRVLRAVAWVGGMPYGSDHFATKVNPALNPRISDGIGRTAIELPPGTSINDIGQFGIQGIGTMSGTLYSLEGFMLDADFLPGARITFSGNLSSSGSNPLWLVVP